jgi:hypothetical protein
MALIADGLIIDARLFVILPANAQSLFARRQEFLEWLPSRWSRRPSFPKH